MVFNTANGSNTSNNVSAIENNKVALDPEKMFGQLFKLSDNLNRDVRVYAINYNVLRIMSGMGGLAYSN